jgi:peptidoglycan/LPS O-acetylase OafA/YrhL
MLSAVSTTREDAAPPVFQPPPGNERFPLFDGVRGLAALGIVLVHVAMAVHANTGTAYGDYVIRLEVVLTFFFVTSGFVLYRPYVAGRLGVGRAPRLSSYARNRFLRIVPAYWLAMTALAITVGLGGFWTDHTWSYYAFLQEVDRGWAFGGILPTWSLTVEVSFYILLPLVAWLMVRNSRGRTRSQILKREGALIATLVLIGLAYRIWIESKHGYDPGSNLWAFLPAQIDSIALGMGLAVLSAAYAGGKRKPRPLELIERRPGLAWLFALAVFVFAAKGNGFSGDFGKPVSTGQWVLQHELYGLIAIGFVLPAVFGGGSRKGIPRRVLGSRAAMWFGTISYGVFLYHDNVAYALKDSSLARIWDFAPMLGLTIATLLVSTACAAASYYLVERPLLRLKRTRTTAPSAPAADPAPMPVGQPEPAARSAG